MWVLDKRIELTIKHAAMVLCMPVWMLCQGHIVNAAGQTVQKKYQLFVRTTFHVFSVHFSVVASVAVHGLMSGGTSLAVTSSHCFSSHQYGTKQYGYQRDEHHHHTFGMSEGTSLVVISSLLQLVPIWHKETPVPIR